MESVLFLCHRLPWPPDKGDKIRSYRILRRLAKHHRVYLGTFIDDPYDWRYLERVKALCADVCVRTLPPWRARARMAAALLRGEPLSVGMYRDRLLQRWVDRVIREHKPRLALCFSAGVAPFLLHHQDLRRVMDFVDVDSDKWRQYARDRRGPAKALYRREARHLAAFERAVAEAFDASILVSDAEAGFFRHTLPEAAHKVHAVANGVDATYWNPQLDFANPYRAGERALVFVGAMDYHANVDAVAWFAREVWPAIRTGRADVRFCIVGSRPTAAVRALGKLPGVTVTGRVEDVRPWVAHAHAVVAPLRIARGIQNKVLEALAMEKVVLATPEAWEGIGGFEGRNDFVMQSREAFAEQSLRWLDAAQPARVAAGRGMVLACHDWSRNLDAYEAVLGNTRAASASAAITSIPLEACP